MYCSHFKLQEKPFQLNTDPRFLWLGRNHAEALATLQYGVIENKGLLLLTGDIGTGKTTLISALVDRLGDENVVVARLPDPGLTRKEFFYLVSRKFGIDRPVRDKETFSDAIGEFLENMCSRDKKALLIIDESQIAGNGVLEEIRLLSNMECRHTKPLNIFLVGQNEFNQKLLQPANRAIRERIAVNYSLKPLAEDETAAYMAHRLRVAGAEQKIFTDDAVREIHAFSKGAPRQINILCDLALVRGYAENAEILDRRMIIECEDRISVPGAAGNPFRGAAETPEGPPPSVAAPDRPQEAVRPRLKPAGFAGRFGIPALVILVACACIFYALWKSGLIKTHTPSLDRVTPTHGQTSPHQPPGSLPVTAPRDPGGDRAASLTDAAPEPSAKKDPPATLDTSHSPSPPQPVIDATRATAAESPAIRRDTAAVPPAETKTDESTPSSPSTEPPDPGDIIEWLLREKSKADNLDKTPDSEPKPSLETAAQSRGESDQIETKESSSDQIKHVVAEMTAGQSTASPPKREEGTEASKKTTDDIVLVTEEKTSNNVPKEIRVITEQPSEEQTVKVRMEGRLRSFLQSYCMTYAAKDLDKFTNFFGPGALENGKPFESLLPQYQKSFNVIEAIQYRIELQQYTYDNQKGTVNIEGNFLLRWLPPDKKWRENSGKIFMNLKDDGRSFLVQNLDYHGSRSTN